MTTVDARGPVTARLGIGSAIVAVGILVVGTGRSDAGGLLLLVGWFVLGASIHAFGRQAERG